MFFSPQYTNETVPEQQQIREGIMEQRQSGEKNPWKKQKRKEREWAWWESYSSGTGNILVQGCQSNVPPPSNTHSCSSLSESRCTWRNPSNPKKHRIPNVWAYVYERERERENPDVSLPLPLSPYSPGGVSEGRGRVHSVVTSTRCAPLTQIT